MVFDGLVKCVTETESTVPGKKIKKEKMMRPKAFFQIIVDLFQDSPEVSVARKCQLCVMLNRESSILTSRPVSKINLFGLLISRPSSNILDTLAR